MDAQIKNKYAYEAFCRHNNTGNRPSNNRISNQTLEELSKFSSKIGINKSKIVEMSLIKFMEDSKIVEQPDESYLNDSFSDNEDYYTDDDEDEFSI